MTPYITIRQVKNLSIWLLNVGKSVSRVGGKTQPRAYWVVAGDLRLSYAQFEELESFARFGTKLDEQTQKILVRGRRIREILKQSQYQPMSAPEQICVLLSVTEGLLDDLPLDKIDQVKKSKVRYEKQSENNPG